MKTHVLAAAAALSFGATALVPAVASAQAPNPAAANAAKFGVAVVDVSYIFKNHAQFRAQMESMKGEMQQIEQQLEGDRQQLIAKEKEKSRFKAGSAEFSQIDDQLAEMKADMQLKMQRLRKDFLAKEAKVYYETYQQVSRVIAYYAQQQKIGIVFRFNGEPADPAQRESILRDINKPVQYQNQIDITPDVLALLNRQQQRAVTPSTGAPRR